MNLIIILLLLQLLQLGTRQCSVFSVHWTRGSVRIFSFFLFSFFVVVSESIPYLIGKDALYQGPLSMIRRSYFSRAKIFFFYFFLFFSADIATSIPCYRATVYITHRPIEHTRPSLYSCCVALYYYTVKKNTIRVPHKTISNSLFTQLLTNKHNIIFPWLRFFRCFKNLFAAAVDKTPVRYCCHIWFVWQHIARAEEKKKKQTSAYLLFATATANGYGEWKIFRDEMNDKVSLQL